MKKGENSVWETILLLSPGEYKYAFLIDGKRINDPNNKRVVHLKSGKVVHDKNEGKYEVH